MSLEAQFCSKSNPIIMQTLNSLSLLSLFLLLLLFHGENGFGAMGPISASFGEDELFCAIDASGKQDVICWGKNTTSPPLLSSSSPYDINNIPAMSALSGGEGFLCGILANTSQAFCWGATMTTRSSVDLGLVPPAYRNIAYSNIVAGKDHVCSVRGSYYADHDSGTEDCWEISRNVNNTLVAKLNGSFSINLEVNRVVSGEGFTCGEVSSSALVCWGPDTESLGVSNVSESFAVLAVGRNTVCGISNFSSDFRCWGDPDSFSDPPSAEVVVDDEEPVINLPLNLKNNFHHVLK